MALPGPCHMQDGRGGAERQHRPLEPVDRRDAADAVVTAHRLAGRMRRLGIAMMALVARHTDRWRRRAMRRGERGHRQAGDQQGKEEPHRRSRYIRRARRASAQSRKAVSAAQASRLALRDMPA